MKPCPMKSMVAAAVFASALVPSLAAAQPGAQPAQPAMLGPEPAQVVAAPVPYDLARRLGVSARGLSLGATSADSETELSYAGGGLGVSYRLNARWELVGSIDALDAEQGSDLHVLAVTARYHMRPHQAWDWYVLAGLGVVHEVPEEQTGFAPDGGEMTEEHGEGRGQVHAGVGLTRRFRRIGLSAELALVHIAAQQEAVVDGAALAMPAAQPLAEELGGATFTLAATYFF